MNSHSKEKKIDVIPRNVLSQCLFGFYSRRDLAIASTVSKEFKICADERASHIVKEYVNPKDRMQKIRIVGDQMDSSKNFKVTDRMHVEIFSQEENNLVLKKTIIPILKNERTYPYYQFDLGKNEFGITYLRLSSSECRYAIGCWESPYDWKRNENFTIFQEIKQNTPSLSDEEKEFINVLEKKNNEEQVSELVKKIKNPNILDEKGIPVLIRAVELGYFEVVKGLVDKKANVEIRNPYHDGYVTPLLQAAAYLCRLNMMKYLVEHGAKVNACDSLGQTALHKISDHLEVFDHGIPYLKNCIKNEEDLQIKSDLKSRLEKYLEDKKNAEEIELFLLHHGANPYLVDLNEDRAGERRYGALLSVATMETDAEERIESWKFEAEDTSYVIKFKDTSFQDKWWAWNAIVNKIKLSVVNRELGLANDSTPWYFSLAFTSHLKIPQRDMYAIQSIKIDYKLSALTISIKDKYKHNSEVHQAIIKCFNELKLHEAEEVTVQPVLRMGR